MKGDENRAQSQTLMQQRQPWCNNAMRSEVLCNAGVGSFALHFLLLHIRIYIHFNKISHYSGKTKCAICWQLADRQSWFSKSVLPL
jgi:hypothetical protein